MSQIKSQIYYTLIDEGQKAKPWLTMVHGFSHNHQYFSEQIPIFRQDFRLFLVDLRGHGQSAEVAAPYGIEEYADDITAALDDAGIEQTHYWGTHTGAAVGLILALRFPERLDSLILEGTFLPGFEMPRVDELLARAKDIAQTQGLEAALEDWFGSADWFAYIRNHPGQCRADKHKQMVFEFQGLPWLSNQPARQVTAAAEFLTTILLPTVIYNGKDDMPDFMRAASKLHTDMPYAQRVVIPDAGGFPGWENPSEVNPLVLRFLKQTIE